MSYPNIIQQHTTDIQTIKSSYLPLAGGTMSGAIKPTITNFISRNGDDSYITINGGTAWKSGASIELSGKDRDTTMKGGVIIQTNDGTNRKDIQAKPDGTFTWNGHQVHTDGTYSGVSYLKENETLSYGWNGLQYFNASLTASEDVGQNVSPTSDWYHIIRMNHGNSAGYYTDLAACFHTDRLYTRRISAGSCATGWNEIPVLVHVWRSGTNGYRIYSDGWKEQWGYVYCGSSGTAMTFNTAFSNTDYHLDGNAQTSSSSGLRYVSFYNRTVTGASMYTGDDASFNSGYVYWYACGY